MSLSGYNNIPQHNTKRMFSTSINKNTSLMDNNNENAKINNSFFNIFFDKKG
jgi:hypothetical protein